jgi:polyisoprenoid-binding protein YceI
MKATAGFGIASLVFATTLLAAPGTHAAELSPTAVPVPIDAASVHVRFRVKVLGLLKVVGRFERLFGSFNSSPRGNTTSVDMHIEAGSVSTDDQWRDALLRGPGFFASERHPQITFSGVCLGPTDSGTMRLTGVLRLRGTSRPVVFLIEPDTDKTGDGAAVYRAHTVIRRSDFGLHAMPRLVSDEVEITVAMNAGSAD